MKNTMKTIAKFDPFDTSDFTGEVIERPNFGGFKKANPSSDDEGRNPMKVVKQKPRKRTAKKARKQQEIDLCDPSQVAEAIANNERLNSSVLELGAAKVRLEDELKVAEDYVAELEARMADLEGELKHKEELLSFAKDHGLIGMKILAWRFLQGLAAVAGGVVVIAYLFF